MRSTLKKVCSSQSVICEFRGTGVECPRSDYAAGKCDKCGWNPAVEEKRIERAAKTK